MSTYLGWSDETALLLEKAGWRHGRRSSGALEKSRHILRRFGDSIPAVVSQTIEEFGGLQVKATGPGQQCARGSFDLDPALAEGEDDRFSEKSRQIGATLFPLGEADDGGGFVAMDGGGRVYLVSDDVYFLGDNIHQGLHAILAGTKPAPARSP